MGYSFSRYIGYGQVDYNAIDCSIAMLKNGGYKIVEQRIAEGDEKLRYILILGYGWYSFVCEDRKQFYTAYPIYYSDVNNNFLSRYPLYT